MFPNLGTETFLRRHRLYILNSEPKYRFLSLLYLFPDILMPYKVRKLCFISKQKYSYLNNFVISICIYIYMNLYKCGMISYYELFKPNLNVSSLSSIKFCSEVKQKSLLIVKLERLSVLASSRRLTTNCMLNIRPLRCQLHFPLALVTEQRANPSSLLNFHFGTTPHSEAAISSYKPCKQVRNLSAE
jgi:hypothetical protein